MNERSRVLLLILIMLIVAVTVSGISIFLLYQAAFSEEQARLVETAQSQARLLEAIARFNSVYTQDYPGGAEAATLSQIRDAHEHYTGFGETGEFTLAKLDDELMVFLLSHRHHDLDFPQPVPFNSELAEPMRRSLSGQSGTVIGLDYRGETVLAAYEPVAELNLGIVAKIDLTEIQAPFVRAGIIAGSSTITMVILGAILFLWVTNPLLNNLKESEKRYRTLAEHLPDMVFRYDKEHRHIYVSPNVVEISGRKAEDYFGKTHHELGYPEEQAQLWEGKIRELFATGNPQKFEFYYDGVQGRRYLNWRLKPEYDSKGDLVYALGITRDVTARKQAEDALRESNRRLEQTLVELKTTQQQALQQERLAAVGQLAAGIAHDFNNILTTILGLAELLQISPDMPDTARSDLGKIAKQGQRAAHLVRQILDFSRKSIRQPYQLDLSSFVKESTRFLNRTIPETIAIVLEVNPVECQVRADPTQLQQALTNLAINARDAMPAGGELRLELSHLTLKPGEAPPCPEMGPGEWAVLSVADTGQGIPAKILPHIFEPFFTTKEVGQGTGLGLAQVYGIIMQHKGHIDVTSHIGQGTTFTIYLPALEIEEGIPTTKIPADMFRGQGETVLLVEDEQNVLEISRAMLEQLNYRVLTATNGQEALATYTEHKNEIALVLTDMVMPKMDGLELLEVLQGQNPDIKIIIMTGYPLGENVSQILNLESVEWLPKPMTISELAYVVSRALR